jgi:hypothetical protein
MTDIYVKFEHWYRLNYWEPNFNKINSGDYQDLMVQSAFLAYRAGFNKARKEGKGRLRYEFDCERFRDATGA